MDINEKDYCELFGVEPEGAQEQEPAEPANGEEPIDAGAQEQEPAEPAAEEPENPEPEEEPEEEPEDEKQQTPQERARYAAIRRKAEAERDAAIKKAREEAQKQAQEQIESAFSSAGLVNPYTKQPIRSKADFDEYKAKLDEDRKNRILKRTGMSEEEFARYVDSMPEVKAAKERAAAAEAAERKVKEEQAQARIAEQMKTISELDPSIQKLEDLTKMENYQEFYNLVKRGNSLADAFKLVNYDKITKRIAAAAAQADRNAAAGKAHLTRTSPRGKGSVSVPPEVRAEYKAFMPDATDAEIAAHYNKYLKK